MLYGGATSGGPLWSVDRQVLFVHGSGGLNPLLFDTVAVTRAIQPGVELGIAMMFHRTPRFSFGGSLGYVGRPTRQGCAAVSSYLAEPVDVAHPVDEHFNEQVCTTANGRRTGTAFIAFSMSVAYRLRPGAIAPYVTLGAGIAMPLRSYVETLGTVTSSYCGAADARCDVQVYVPEEHNVRPVLSPGAGVTVKLAPLATLVLEGRDVMGWYPVTGPTPPFAARFTTHSVFKHAMVLRAGLEFAFVVRHERRY